MIDENTRDAIRSAFRAGLLMTEAVDPVSGEVVRRPITAVLRHETGDRPAVRVVATDGRSVTTTGDHSLFCPTAGAAIIATRADAFREGDLTVAVLEGTRADVSLRSVEDVMPLPVSYDLSVPGPENFVLANGLVAHNSYSIGGISLDIEKSSKYMDLKRNAEEQWDKMVEAKHRTTKFARGLSQPRFGIGGRSAFGPSVGRGVLSPRSFV